MGKTIICPSCKQETDEWQETCMVTIRYRIGEKGETEELDKDFDGDTYFSCPECGAGWDSSLVMSLINAPV